MRHWQPVRAIYKIASSTARKLVSRGRPNALRAGMEGSITAHSASVRSLAYRCPARSYFGRVISVHMLYLDDCSTQPLCYNHLKSLNSFPVSLSECAGAGLRPKGHVVISYSREHPGSSALNWQIPPQNRLRYLDHSTNFSVHHK